MKRDLGRKPQRAVRRSAASTVSAMKRLVVEHDAVASTELFRGIHYESRGSKTIIESSAPHSGYVEFGTGPKHTLNPYTRRYRKPEFSGALVASLIEWATIKPSLPVENPSAFGWAVARSISGEADGSIGGTEPQPFFVPTWEQKKTIMMDRVRDAVTDSVRR